MATALASIQEDVPEIDLKMNITRHYNEKHLNPTRNEDNQMRRLNCTIQKLNFNEIEYKMSEQYVNKQEPGNGTSIYVRWSFEKMLNKFCLLQEIDFDSVNIQAQKVNY